MSQFGMQLPGGQVRAKAGPDVYSGLLLLAAVALAAACLFVFTQGQKVGKGATPDQPGNAFALRDVPGQGR